MSDLGQRIKEARLSKGLTQTELGKLIGKSLRTVQLYEKGQTDLSVAILFDIAHKLEINPADLICPRKPEVPTNTLSDVLAVIFKIFESESLACEVDVRRPPYDDTWRCNISIDGKGEAEYNADFCLALESFQKELIEYRTGKQTKEDIDRWQNRMLTYYEKFNLK